jgi:hypothetical protein
MTQAANLGALGTNAGTTGILPAAGGGTGTASGVTGFKNRIINGQMVLDQRNAGASVTPTTDTYTLDRWQIATNVSSKVSVQQSSTVPTGFTNSTLITSLSAYTIGAGELCLFRQPIEGYNVADLGFGTANAKTFTVSFWVRSSLTGTFGGALTNGSENRSYPFTYTISAADTWEQKTITIAGDTSGTWLTTNGAGLKLVFGLGVGSTFSGTAGSWSANAYFSATGSTSLLATNGATFYITGVQLEVGSTATSFDYRPYGTELALCQRYFFQVSSTGAANGQNTGMTGLSNGSTSLHRTNMALPVTMRTTPTITLSNVSGVGTDLRVYNGAAVHAVTSLGTQFSNPNYLQADFDLAGSFTTGNYLAVLWRDNVTGGFIRASAEL